MKSSFFWFVFLAMQKNEQTACRNTNYIGLVILLKDINSISDKVKKRAYRFLTLFTANYRLNIAKYLRK